MLYSCLKFVLAGMVFSSLAFPCGKNLGAVRPGNKVVGIEVKGEGGKPSTWLMDDDGMMVVSLVAAYCNKDIPYLQGEFTPEQVKCVTEHQDSLKIPYEDQLSTTYFSENDVTKTETNKVIKAECGFDVLAMWKQFETKRSSGSLKCVGDVRGIVKKAAWRSAEYLKEESDPKNLESLNATPDQKKDHLAVLKADVDYAKALSDMFSQTPVSVKTFETWLKEISDVAERHGYQVVDNPDDKFNPEKQTPLHTILFEVGAKLPGILYSKCGRFPTEIIKQLQSAVWDVRGTDPGLQGGAGNEVGAGK